MTMILAWNGNVMRKNRFFRWFLLVCVLVLSSLAHSQELLTPLQYGMVSDGRVSPKTAQTLRMPFFDDFSNYTGVPDSGRWMLPSGAVVNRDYDALPPTLGMVTLDAISDKGVIYPLASTAPFAADTLQSCDIRLDSVWDASPHAARLSDSILLSFYYLPGGGMGPEWQHVGVRPGPQDSLILEFWHASRGVWVRVWATGGLSVDSLVAATGHRWQRVNVMIADEGYLSSSFAFRFRNLCSLDDNPLSGMVGNCDQWSLDYVWLDAHRSQLDSTMHDVAFVSEPPSMLRDFQAMPARQYGAEAMADSIRMVIANRYSSPIATRYQYTVCDAEGEALYTYDGGFANVQPFLPGEVYQTAPAHAMPRVAYSFPVNGTPQTFFIRHAVHEGVGGDERGENDTVTFVQRFADYYAYDDGLPEKGYGVVATGQPRIAVQFPLAVPDTLTVVSLFFNPTQNDANASITFRLAVWDDAGGVPGSLLYCDENMRRADETLMGAYQRFVLERPLPVSGTIYVGLVQQVSGYINLGFDCGHDHHDRCFYAIGNVWQTTVYSGSLMLRPAFGSAAMVGVGQMPDVALSLWPNPVSDWLHVSWSGRELTGGTVAVYDMMGRCLTTRPVGVTSTMTLPTDAWSKGCYLLVLKNRDGVMLTQKRFCK